MKADYGWVKAFAGLSMFFSLLMMVYSIYTVKSIEEESSSRVYIIDQESAYWAHLKGSFSQDDEQLLAKAMLYNAFQHWFSYAEGTLHDNVNRSLALIDPAQGTKMLDLFDLNYVHRKVVNEGLISRIGEIESEITYDPEVRIYNGYIKGIQTVTIQNHSKRRSIRWDVVIRPMADITISNTYKSQIETIVEQAININ